MSDELLIPAGPTTDEPFSNRWGLSAGCGLRVPISTSISEGGIGGICGLSLDIAENFDEVYSLKLDVPFGTTDQKIFPTTDSAGTKADHHHWAFRAGFGKAERLVTYFGDEGDFRLSLNMATAPMIGVGQSTISRDDYELDGEVFSFDDASSKTFDIGTNYALMAEIRPGGRFPALQIGPALHYGLQYAGEGSEFNRVKLEFMLMASIGYGDASTIGGADSDMELGAMGITQGIYALGHGLLQRYLFTKSISQPMEALDDYGLLDDTGAEDRGSMADVPLLSAAASVMGGHSLTPPLRAGKGWFWGFAAMQALGGGLFLAVDSTDAKAGGLGDLLGVGRLVSYAIADIEAPDDRLEKEDAEVEKREVFINLAWYAANAAVFLIGAGAKSDVAIVGGTSANNSLAMTPNPTGRNTVERTDVGYVPITAFWGERNGSRAGMIIHKGWHDFPTEKFQLYSSVLFLSPMMTFGNIGRAASQDENYADVMLPTDVGAGLGFEWKTTWTRLSFGIETRGIFGGEKDARAALGGMAGFDLTFPFNGEEDGSGLALGVRATAHKVFPKGAQYEIAPWLGATLHF